MINKDKKLAIIAEVKNNALASQAILIAENGGLTADEIGAFRKQIRADGVGKAQVVKNTLAKRAFVDSVYEPLGESLTGPLIYVAAKDVTALAKIFSNTAKTNKKFIIRGGALAAGTMLSAADIGKLATIPNREQLLSSLLAAMQSPITAFVRTLNEIPTKFARTLSAIAKQKEDNGQ